jgi:PAS domain S-box-containing protein
MAFSKDQLPLKTTLGLVFLAMLMVMFAYELAKQSISPAITIWESHAITILFTSIVSVIILYFPLRSLHREQALSTAALRQQQEAEALLRQSEARYRSFVESAEDSIYTVDLDLRYLLINTQHLARRGIAPESYAGKNYRDFHTPEETAVFEALVRQVAGKKGSVQNEYLRGERSFLRRLNPVFDPSDNTVTAVTVITSDITRQKAAGEALGRANRKLATLSTITRHDIKNQLAALTTYLELSQQSLDDREKVEEFLRQERKIAETLGHQIDFTKVYEDMGTTAPVWQNVGESVRRAMAGLPMRDIRVEIGDPGVEVLADPLFEKVFYNLIDNALRYGGDGMTTIRIGARETPEGLVLVCEDNGAGILPEDRPRLFTQGFGKNTGFGLFLIREILSITGITIRETGEPVRGCRFEMAVPKGAYRTEHGTA